MEKKYGFTYESYAIGDLPEADKVLVEAARKATASAYSPYSKFSVGAAARCASGHVRTGSNQESEVFPSTICAERSLLYHHQANHASDTIEAIAITSSGDRECYPCGMCRQVLIDTENRQGKPIRVIMAGKETASVIPTVRCLLPFLFEL